MIDSTEDRMLRLALIDIIIHEKMRRLDGRHFSPGSKIGRFNFA